MLDASGQRSHVERRINEAEAAVVRRIFELCAAGSGLTRITKTLNGDEVPAPRPQRGRPVGWAHSTVPEVLLRELYRGVIVWNQTRKRDRWGQHHQHARPEAEWMRVPAPHLRVVSEDVWQAAHARLNTRRAQYSAPKQRPVDAIAGTRTLDVVPRYLLTGMGRCAICGGGWLAQTRDHGAKRVKLYGCASHWKRGPRVCANGLVARVEVIDAEIVATLAEDVLRPTVIEQALALAFEDLAPAGTDRTRRRLEAELMKVTDECGRLAEAIGRGGRLTPLLDRLTRPPRGTGRGSCGGSDVRPQGARAAAACEARRLARAADPERGHRQRHPSHAAGGADPIHTRP
jgi:site-specific DNA recombinase